MNIIFDFDGTIADSLPVILPFANKTLRQFNKETITPLELKTKGVKYIIKSRKISNWSLMIYILFSRHNLESHIHQAKPFEGIKQASQKLFLKNNLGIITSSSEKTVNRFLTKYKLIDQFEFVVGSFGLFGKHKKISKIIRDRGWKKSETIYIGDESRDVEAAKKAGVISGAVTWGFEGEALLKKAKPDYIFRKPEDLLKLYKD